MPLDDLPLSHSPVPPPPADRDGRDQSWRWLVAIAAVVIAAASLTVWWLGRAQPPPVTPAPAAAPADAGQTLRRPLRQPIDMPPLGDSDPLIRQLAQALSAHPLLVRLLATRGLVRAAVLAVVQIGDGRTPKAPLAVLRPASRLDITGAASGSLTAASLARWNDATGALLSVTPADAAQLYVNVKPLFDEAYRELGNPEEDFDRAIVKAIQMLDATPVVDAGPILLRRDGYFEYADEALRALKPVQKQWILIGPTHRARVLTWLRQFAAALGLQLGP